MARGSELGTVLEVEAGNEAAKAARLVVGRVRERCSSLETAAIWSRLGKSAAAECCWSGVKGGARDPVEGVDAMVWATFCACDERGGCEEEGDRDTVEASLRGDLRTGGGVRCTTIVRDDACNEDLVDKTRRCYW